jgi:hypothetical protein
VTTEGQRFYLCEPPVTIAPTEYLLGGITVEKDLFPSVVTRELPASPRSFYSELVFPRPIDPLAGAERIYASGGRGLSPTSVLRVLIEGVAGLKIADSAQATLSMLDRSIDFAVFLDASGDAMDLVTDRLLPQTNVTAYSKMGEIDLIDFVAPGSDRLLRIGRGILYRLRNQRDKLSSLGDVYNIIEVSYRATSSRTARAPAKFLLDHRYPGPLGRLSARSQKTYGPRILQVAAEDLPSADTVGDEGGHPVPVVGLAEGVLLSTAMQHRSETYQMTWAEGAMISRNTRRIIDDPEAGLPSVGCRAVDIEIHSFGPQVTFQTEDIDP